MMMPELTEEQQERVRKAYEAVPYFQLLGIRVESVSIGRSVLSMEVREDLKQNDAIVHGGAIASLLDSSIAFAIIPLLAGNERTTTVDLTVHYVRPLTAGAARATAKVVRSGRRVITVSAEVTDQNEKLAATALSTYLRIVT